jgi:hypothetical protein
MIGRHAHMDFQGPITRSGPRSVGSGAQEDLCRVRIDPATGGRFLFRRRGWWPLGTRSR